MFIVRDVFKAKPGKSKLLVSVFKEASQHMIKHGPKNIRVLTDVVADYWTVIWEFEVEEVDDYFKMNKSIDGDSAVYNSLEGYKEYIVDGHREIFKIEY